MLWYKLMPDHSVVATDDLDAAKAFDRTNRKVGATTINEVDVSTVFLGLDHDYSGKGPPILFETMVFGGELDQEQERYATWDEAVAGHEAMCVRVTKSEATKKP